MNNILIITASLLFMVIVPEIANSDKKHSDNILLVFAHPDDETWMNGTIAKLINNGYTLHLIYVTSGDKGRDRSARNLKGASLAKEREKEVINALGTLGVLNNINFLRFPDGEVRENTSEISKIIEIKIKQISPALVFTFGPGGITGHPDHISVGLTTQRVIDSSEQRINFYNIAINSERNKLLARAASNHGIENFKQIELADDKKFIRIDVSSVAHQRKLSPKSHKTQFQQPLLNAWDEFVSNSKYEEFSYSKRTHPETIRLMKDL